MSPSETDAPTFRVGGVPEHFNLPWHLAFEDKAFSAANLNVHYQDFPGGTGAMTRGLADDEIDIAILLTEGGVTDILNGSENRIVKVYVQSPLIWGIHVAAKSDHQAIVDVKGQKYAISRFGSGSHLMAIVDADERGWSTDDMEFVKVGGLEGARKSLPAGESDVFLWERFTTKPYVDRGEFRRIGQRVVPWPAFVISVNKKRMAKHGSSIRKILEIVDKYSLKLMNDPQAVSMVAKRYDLELNDTEEWFSKTKWQQGFELPEAEFKKVIASLDKLKLIKKSDATIEDIIWPI